MQHSRGIAGVQTHARYFVEKHYIGIVPKGIAKTSPISYVSGLNSVC